MTKPTVDVDRAQLSRTPDGILRVDDPDSPLVVTVDATLHNGRPYLRSLTVQARHPGARVTAAALGRLPVQQLVLLAAAGTAHANEAYYRALARPKPPGRRTWDAGHWERVLTVHEWATQTGRPGGGVRAVADLWGVSADPTAYRWVREARRRATRRR